MSFGSNVVHERFICYIVPSTHSWGKLQSPSCGLREGWNDADENGMSSVRAEAKRMQDAHVRGIHEVVVVVVRAAAATSADDARGNTFGDGERAQIHLTTFARVAGIDEVSEPVGAQKCHVYLIG